MHEAGSVNIVNIPVNIAKFSKTPILKNICERLHLQKT